MYRNKMTATGYRQQGWLMPVAAFIIVVIGFLVAVLSRVNAESSLAIPQEHSSLQAFYAAESGAQYAVSSLYFDAVSPITRTSASAACLNINGDNIIFTAAGMNNCRANILCRESVDAGNTMSFYRITSTGICGADNIAAERIVEVDGVME